MNEPSELIKITPGWFQHAVCSCSWVGPWRWRMTRAMDDALTHAHYVHPAAIAWGKSDALYGDDMPEPETFELGQPRTYRELE